MVLLSAMLFGLVSVVAKSSILSPLFKGGLAYLLAGVALLPFFKRHQCNNLASNEHKNNPNSELAKAVMVLLRNSTSSWTVLYRSVREIFTKSSDGSKILAMATIGGAIAPTALFFGLDKIPATDASFLMTLELVFTAVLARIFLREQVVGRAALGFLLLFSSALMIAFAENQLVTNTTTNDQQQQEQISTVESHRNAQQRLGYFLVTVATLGWGIDNTLSTYLTGSHTPVTLLTLKGLFF